MDWIVETRLTRALQNQFEAWFQEDLSWLRISFFSDAAGLLSGYPRAFSAGTDVFLAHSVRQWPSWQAQYVLAHEIAHVVQRLHARMSRLRHVAIPETRLEREANAAAAAFVTGSPCPTLSPDITPVPRAWGSAGHYYTVYAVGRHAGLSDQLAEQLAFYSQLPDQVSDLDAIVAGVGFTVGALLPPAHRHAAMSSFEGVTKTSQGLHCLNGRAGGLETERRLEILKRMPVRDLRGRFSFGLGLHALGDSFSHRQGNSDIAPTYIAPYGHLLAGKGFIEKLLNRGGTEVDNLATRAPLYRQYCQVLFSTLQQKFGGVAPGAANAAMAEGQASRERPLDVLITAVINESEEPKQIARLLNAFSDKSSRYRPENESCMPWQDFLRAHPRETASWMPAVARQLMEHWL